MAKFTSSGKCRLCGQLVGKAQMTNHLKSCLKRTTPSASGSSETRSYHLVAEAPYSSYWLHLQASADATFRDLDGLLRRIWLECCGHCSAFRFPEEKLSSFMDFEEDLMKEIHKLMSQPLGRKLKPGLKFSYEYDFGSTTNLSFRVVAELPGLPKKRSFALFARNEPPLIPCGQCSKPATQVCAEHVYEDAGWLCDACAAEHECGEDMLMPIINSPRTGVCGYVGPSQEP